MNIARAAKGAAYLLMVFGLVALVACQAGPAGPKGATGDKGDPGVAGKPGAPGTAALTAVGGSTTPHIILINNKGTAAAPVTGDLKKPNSSTDVTALFVGGATPLTYTISAGPAATAYFTASINDDNMIVVGKRTGATEPTLTAAGAHYTTGTEITVQAADAQGRVATKSVAIRHNRAPGIGDATVPGHARLSLIVGTQSEEHKASTTVTYTAKNKIHNLDISSTGTPPAYQRYFSEDGDDALALLTFEILKIERGDNDAKKAAEHATAKLSGARNHLLSVTGLKSTWDTSLDTPAHTPVNVEIEATDSGGLKRKHTFTVTVDGAPQAGATPPPATYFSKADDIQKAVARDLADFYSDPEGIALAVGDISVAPPTTATATMDGDDLVLTAKNPGKAILTYYVRSAANPSSGPALRGASLDRDGDGNLDSGAGIFTYITNQVIKGTIEVTVSQ